MPLVSVAGELRFVPAMKDWSVLSSTAIVVLFLIVGIACSKRVAGSVALIRASYKSSCLDIYARRRLWRVNGCHYVASGSESYYS